MIERSEIARKDENACSDSKSKPDRNIVEKLGIFCGWVRAQKKEMKMARDTTPNI